jgi:DNA-binding PadR family transcriptional regulator
VLEIALLGLLTEQEMHGYELKKRLSDVFGLSSAVSFGSLYPALARLKAAGAVEVLGPGGPKEDLAPAEGGTAQASRVGRGRRPSRRRKVYRITAQGAEMFRELLTSNRGANGDDRSFSLRLAFARYLPPEARLGLLEQRRAVLGERLTQLAARARARRDDRYMRILAERQREELAHDVSWLERLIQEERAAGEPGLGGTSPSTAGNLATGPSAATSYRQQAPQGQLGPQLTPEAGRHVPLASASQLRRPRELGGPAPEGTGQKGPSEGQPGATTPRGLEK